MTTKGVTPEVEAAFASVLDLFEQGADVRQQYSVLRGMASLYLFRAQLDETARLAREILALGDAERDPDMLIDGHLLVGATKSTVDDLEGGLDHFDQAIALFPARPGTAQTVRVGNDPRVSTLTTSAITLWLMGFPDLAADRANAALALATRLDHPFTSAYALFHAGLLRFWRRDPDIALDLAIRLLELSDEHGFRIWTAAGGCLLGAVQVELGRSAEGLANVRSGVDLYQELRSPPIFWPFLLFLDAGASGRAGRPADGLRAVDAAIEILGAGSGTTVLPELHILKGDLLGALPPDEGGGASSAEPWYRLAFDRAGELNARMSMLRAATRSGRLRLADGEPEAAAAILGPVYASFTEGFATADLRDAEALLATVVPGHDRDERG